MLHRKKLKPISDKRRRERLLEGFIPNSTLKRISDKRRKQIVEEKILSQMLWIKQNGKCARCGCVLFGTFPPPSKHEIIRRSAGGDPLSEENCEILCHACHDEVTRNVNPKDKGVHR